VLHWDTTTLNSFSKSHIYLYLLPL